MKQEIAQIRAAYDQEDNKIPVKVESALKGIEKALEKHETTVSGLETTIEEKETSVNDLFKESKKRQTKNQELEREVETIKAEKDKILTDTKHEDYDELKKYKTDNETKLADDKKITRTQFIEWHGKNKDHKDYEKCKSGYTIPEEKDGKIDWNSVDDDVMVANDTKLKEQKGYGFFADGTGGKDEPKGGKGGQGGKDVKVTYKPGTFKTQ